MTKEGFDKECIALLAHEKHYSRAAAICVTLDRLVEAVTHYAQIPDREKGLPLALEALWRYAARICDRCIPPQSVQSCNQLIEAVKKFDVKGGTGRTASKYDRLQVCDC